MYEEKKDKHAPHKPSSGQTGCADYTVSALKQSLLEGGTPETYQPQELSSCNAQRPHRGYTPLEMTGARTASNWPKSPQVVLGAS